MPAPRRRNAGAAPAPVSETVTPATDTEGEDKPKRTRAPKDYKIVSEEMAELVNETLDTDDHSEGDPITGELISQLREGGMKWDGTDEKPGIKFVAGIKSAIPLRTLLQKYEADGEGAIDADDADAIVAAMKSDGAGWTQLSARTGLSVADVKAAIKEKLAEEDIDVDDGGRGYGKGDGWRWVTREELNASKVANKQAADDAGDEDDDEDEDDDTPAPAPRRRGRTGASA
jgi:hypothetical protein